MFYHRKYEYNLLFAKSDEEITSDGLMLFSKKMRTIEEL